MRARGSRGAAGSHSLHSCVVAAAACAFGLAAGCGGSQTSGSPTDAAVDTARPSGAGAQAKLQGTWEIVKYVSKERIPDEAMPLLGAMFEDLRFKIANEQVVVDGKASPFKAVDDNGSTFRLSTDGMFNKAMCHFVSADEFEVDDPGPIWPGKTIMHRDR